MTASDIEVTPDTTPPRLPEGVSLCFFPLVNGETSSVVLIGGNRPVVAVNFWGNIIPFIIETGRVNPSRAKKWVPFFGVSQDGEAALNEVPLDLALCPTLEKVADFLDARQDQVSAFIEAKGTAALSCQAHDQNLCALINQELTPQDSYEYAAFFYGTGLQYTIRKIEIEGARRRLQAIASHFKNAEASHAGKFCRLTFSQNGLFEPILDGDGCPYTSAGIAKDLSTLGFRPVVTSSFGAQNGDQCRPTIYIYLKEPSDVEVFSTSGFSSPPALKDLDELKDDYLAQVSSGRTGVIATDSFSLFGFLPKRDLSEEDMTATSLAEKFLDLHALPHARILYNRKYRGQFVTIEVDAHSTKGSEIVAALTELGYTPVIEPRGDSRRVPLGTPVINIVNVASSSGLKNDFNRLRNDGFVFRRDGFFSRDNPTDITGAAPETITLNGNQCRFNPHAYC